MEKATYRSTGKRKNAVARVVMSPGKGEFVVNERPYSDYFSRRTLRAIVQQPLELVGVTGQYDIRCNVTGGGSSGQAGAVRHGIARALLEVNASFRERLKKEGLLTRDSRVKERKKYGQKGARKRFQFSKR
jgi:small subunit ribosomal protein S9